MVPCDTVFRYPDNPSTRNPLTLLIASRTQFLKEGGFGTFYLIRICAHQTAAAPCVRDGPRTSQTTSLSLDTKHGTGSSRLKGRSAALQTTSIFSRSFDVILQLMKACGFIRSIFCRKRLANKKWNLLSFQ